MKEEIYSWMKNLAVFYILLTAVLHLVPDRKYERYVRFFMGLLLILMMCTPVFTIFGKNSALMESFETHYRAENIIREETEAENIQMLYLKKGYEQEIRRKITEALEKRDIYSGELEVNIDGEGIRAVLYLEKVPDAEERKRIADGFMEAGGLREGEYQIKIAEHEPAAVGGTSASGAASCGGVTSGIP